MRDISNRDTKVIDPHLGDPPSSRTSEVVIVRELREDGSAVGTLRRLPAHRITLAASVVGGSAIHVGQELLVTTKAPERFGFRGATREWTATAIVQRGETK